MSEKSNTLSASTLIAELALAIKEHGDLPIMVTEWAGARRIHAETVEVDNGEWNNGPKQIKIG